MYGPPGTGKTYRLQASGRRPPEASAVATSEARLEQCESLPFWQVFALALLDLGGKADIHQLIAHPYVQRRYTAQPLKAPLRNIAWAEMQRHTILESTMVALRNRTKPPLFDRQPDGKWFFAVPIPEEISDLAAQLKPGSAPRPDLPNIRFVTFHPSYTYEDFIEGIRPVPPADDDDDRVVYRVTDGLLVRAAQEALRLTNFNGTVDEFCKLTREERKRHLVGAPILTFCIDEINRGHVARIFGELISLIEYDKRLGMKNELVVQLPYSQRLFGVPANLEIIGTMNTADRSVEALDVALRRRFDFEECLPDTSLLDFTVEGVEIGRMLGVINERLSRLYDRDHQIGHTYLLPLREHRDLAELRQVFKHRILPLLQEYFYNDWAKIGLVLGDRFVRQRASTGATFAEFDDSRRADLQVSAAVRIRGIPAARTV